MERRQEMNKTYLITLTPAGKFFFGGDMTFTVDGKETDYTSYIIRSNKFPQQTSLLGMLRFLVLRNDSCVFDSSSQSITNRDRATTLIGAKSFEVSGSKGDFGVIKSLSPCFIQAKKDDKWNALTLKSKIKVDFTETTKAVLNGVEVEVPLTDYDPKKYCETFYQFENGETVKDSDIFTEDISNGINRDIHTGKTDDGALFKQISWRMKEEYRFAFYAEVDLDNLVDCNGQIVSVGADSSQFVIGISEYGEQKNDCSEGTVVTLLSPTYLTREDLASVRFAITETMPFKSMKTVTQSVKSYNKRNQLYDYSDKMMLYTTGSVFYLKSSESAKDFTEKLKAHADFYQIGYNHYKVTN